MNETVYVIVLGVIALAAIVGAVALLLDDPGADLAAVGTLGGAALGALLALGYRRR